MAKKTLYEMLEVSENASPEVIEKAYKILVKKYHPDLQPANEKANAETKMKEINEAYSVLSDEQKRADYDNDLKAKREQAKMQEKQAIYNQATTQRTQSYNQANTSNNGQNYDYDRKEYEQRLKKEEAAQRKKMQENLNKEYENAYNNYLRSLGYKVKTKWTKEKVRDLLITIAVIIVIAYLLWIIPPTHNWLVSIYENNTIIRTVVNIVVSIVTGVFSGIKEFFTWLFN